MIDHLYIRCRDDAEAARPDQHTAVISITDPGSEPARLQDGWLAILRVQFRDINMDQEMSPFLRADIVKTRPPMRLDDAVRIIGFVRGVLAVGARGFLVHCEAGISRSAAVAKWIGERYGAMPTDHELVAHNRYVHRMLVEASEL